MSLALDLQGNQVTRTDYIKLLGLLHLFNIVQIIRTLEYMLLWPVRQIGIISDQMMHLKNHYHSGHFRLYENYLLRIILGE